MRLSVGIRDSAELSMEAAGSAEARKELNLGNAGLLLPGYGWGNQIAEASPGKARKAADTMSVKWLKYEL
jgi:hypothetical protein